jgi:hypothetical protein
LFHEIYAGRQGKEPWGLISWKFKHKTSVPVPVFRDFCENRLKAGYDCVFINPMIGNEAIHYNVWEQGERCGCAGMLKIARHLQLHAGLDTLGGMGTDCFSFCNYFVGTPVFWDAYLTFVDNAVAGLKAEAGAGTGVGKIFTGSGNYHRDRSVSMRIFVIERLFSSFVKTRPEIRCTPFPHSRNLYLEKFGKKLGVLLHRLSLAKNHALLTNDAGLLKQWNEMRRGLFDTDYINTIWHLDDPHDLYLSEEYARLAERLSRTGLDDS